MPSSRHRRRLVLTACVLATVATAGADLRAQSVNPGLSQACRDFQIGLYPILQVIFPIVPTKDISDEGWVWVDPAQKIRTVTGVVTGTSVATTDTPANHDSHDVDIDVKVDPGQDDLLTEVSKDSDNPDCDPDAPGCDPDTLGIEWETGLDPDDDKSGDGSAFFPKWAWPSVGDRIWANGHWIFDCGHVKEAAGADRYHSEIHPPRAVATMRDQAAPLPGTGTTPVPVTTTDIWIHGRGGFATEQLNCGMQIILGDHGDTCGQDPPPASDAYKYTPIAENFTFDVCLPPRPAGGAFVKQFTAGPYNTIGIDPIAVPVAASGACATDPRFDTTTMMRVTVPLAGSGVAPTEVFARRIDAGWVVPPDPPLPQRRVALDLMDLHEDHDPDPGDGNLSMMWLNVDRARAPWLRLSDFAGGMNDYDDDHFFGDGEKHFPGLDYHFYLRPDTLFAAHSTVYEQDCYDQHNNFGDHKLRVSMYVYCHTIDIPDPGGNDGVASIHESFDGTFLGARKAKALRTVTVFDQNGQPHQITIDDYDLYLSVSDVPLTNEDTADASVAVACAPSGEVALIGQPFTCTAHVGNAGPGLPRQTSLDDGFVPGGPTVAINSSTWTVAAPFAVGTQTCSAIGSDSVHCNLVTVPFGGDAAAVITATPAGTGFVTNRAIVAAVSSDPNTTNNSATSRLEVFRPVTIDIEPGDTANVVNLNRGGTVSVAILTTPDFDAATADVNAVCFGDADAPGERVCTERHGRGHMVDVDRDGDLDLVLHYIVESTGIDLGDQRACLIGHTLNGAGFFGCDAVSTQAPK
jgi:uncharacterized protein DUF11